MWNKEGNREASGSGKLRKLLLEGLLYVALILFSVFILPEYVVQRTIVEGSSMESTLKDDDNLIVNKFLLQVFKPKRYDIVVFYPFGKGAHPYGDDIGDYFVKRVIGLPGEEILITEGDIYINGEKLEDGYGKNDVTMDPGIAEEPIKLGEDEYFLIGDNREEGESFDSRDPDIGPVHKDKIAGKAVLRIWPLDKFGFLH